MVLQKKEKEHLKHMINDNIMEVFFKMIAACNGIVKQELLKQNIERDVYLGKFRILKKHEVIIKINKNKNDTGYTKTEFNHTELAYKLCYKDLYKVSDNPIPKPIYFDKEKVILNYIPGHSREWPFSKENRMNDFEYCAATKYLAKLHSVSIRKTRGLEKEQYGGSSISEKLKDDYKKLKQNQLFEYREKLDMIASYMPEMLNDGKKHEKDLVYSHGDFKPGNFVFSNYRIYHNQNVNRNSNKINMSVIDWTGFGLRLRQYDLGSLLFGIENLEKLYHYLNFYFEGTNFEPTDKTKFLKEAMALSCIVHINAPLGTNPEIENVTRYIDYTYNIIKKLE